MANALKTSDDQIVTIQNFEKYVGSDLEPLRDRNGAILYETEVLSGLEEKPRELLRLLFYDAIRSAKARASLPTGDARH